MKGKIIPVIHTIDLTQVKYNLDLCKNNGVDFVFLINHGFGPKCVDTLINYHNFAKENYDIKIGLNFLQLDTPEAMAIVNSMETKPDALWVDKSYITPNDLSKADLIKELNDKSIKYFGAVAFKYQKQPTKDELQLVCETATNYMDVITTSGAATGVAADLEKIRTIKSYISNHEMAIASGVDYKNKDMYSDFVDYLLVASSITNPQTEMIIESKLKEILK